MPVEIFLVFVFFCFLVSRKVFFDRKTDAKKLSERLDAEWGKPTRPDYSDAVWMNIFSFFRHHKTDDSVDDITWNDLGLDEIYKRINHTRTSAGENMLYFMLRQPLFEEEELLHRERMIDGFFREEELRKRMEAAFFSVGKEERFSVYDYLLNIKKLQPFSRLPHLFCAAFLACGTVLLAFMPIWFLFVFLGILSFNTFFYFHTKGKHIRDISLFHFIFRLVKGCKEIGNITFPELAEEIGEVKRLTGKFKKYGRFHFLVAGGSSMSGTVLDSLFDYIRILFHVDLIKMATMVKEIRKYESELLTLFEVIGRMDAMLAAASYRSAVETYTLPVFLGESHQEKLVVENLYHPLVDRAVPNSLTMEKSILLTGSNASGKSTFLKAVAVNMLLSQSLHMVLANRYQAPFYKVFSSMALRDNLLEQESYFVVEVKSLKRLFDAGESSKVPVFCFVDEILRGTNTVERVAASSLFLKKLLEHHAVCMAATHDMELTYLLEECYDNYHFEESVDGKDVRFDYILKKGRASSRNAIVLMENLGFEKDLTQAAEKRAEHFLKEGEWV